MSSSNGVMKSPEYRKMKFCEMFHVTPMEYDEIPYKTVDLFMTMKNIEQQFERKNDRQRA